MKRNLKSMFGSRFRAGSYSTFAALAVVAIAVVLNLMMVSLPAAYTQVDMTSNGLFTLSDQTKQILSLLDKDVDLYLLATSGSEDETVKQLLERYASLSSRLHVTYVDPTAKPTFLNSYDLDIRSLYANSVLVDCDGRYRLVGYDEIFVTEYYMDYYSYSYEYTTEFNGEAALTGAIHYVSSDSLPKVYTLSGHGETQLSSSVQELMAKDSMTTESLSLLSLDAVPEDATAIVINAPTGDLSADEAQLLIDYLHAGGSVILFTDYIDEGKMTNLLQVTAAMGVTARTGLIMDGDRNHRVSRYPHYLLPDVTEHDITSALISGGYYILVPMAQPITSLSGSAAEVTMLLNTSSSAYLKADGLNTQSVEQAAGDETGSYCVGVAATLGDARLLWITSGDFIEDSCDNTVAGANSNLFLNALNWMGGQEQAISIRAKSMDRETLTVPDGQSRFWSIMMIGVIPAAFIVLGVLIWIRRKRR